jgi:IclR family acetate operon transcriptional repressor
MKRDEQDHNAYSIRAVERVCDILDLLQDAQGVVSLPQVAQAVDLPKSSVFRYMTTLERRGYAERDPVTGDYRLGLAFLPLQASQLDLLVQAVRPYLESLRAEFEETVSFGVLDGERVLQVEAMESPRGVRAAAQPGARDPLHASALGKAIASQLDDAQLRALLRSAGMPRLTSHTIVAVGPFLEEVGRVRERRWAFEERERDPDTHAVAIPLRSGRPAALGLSAPAERLPRDAAEAAVKSLHDVAEHLARSQAGAQQERPA